MDEKDSLSDGASTAMSEPDVTQAGDWTTVGARRGIQADSYAADEKDCRQMKAAAARASSEARAFGDVAAKYAAMDKTHGPPKDMAVHIKAASARRASEARAFANLAEKMSDKAYERARLAAAAAAEARRGADFAEAASRFVDTRSLPLKLLLEMKGQPDRLAFMIGWAPPPPTSGRPRMCATSWNWFVYLTIHDRRVLWTVRWSRSFHRRQRWALRTTRRRRVWRP